MKNFFLKSFGLIANKEQEAIFGPLKTIDNPRLLSINDTLNKAKVIKIGADFDVSINSQSKISVGNQPSSSLVVGNNKADLELADGFYSHILPEILSPDLPLVEDLTKNVADAKVVGNSSTVTEPNKSLVLKNNVPSNCNRAGESRKDNSVNNYYPNIHRSCYEHYPQQNLLNSLFNSIFSVGFLKGVLTLAIALSIPGVGWVLAGAFLFATTCFCENNNRHNNKYRNRSGRHNKNYCYEDFNYNQSPKQFYGNTARGLENISTATEFYNKDPNYLNQIGQQIFNGGSVNQGELLAKLATMQEVSRQRIAITDKETQTEKFNLPQEVSVEINNSLENLDSSNLNSSESPFLQAELVIKALRNSKAKLQQEERVFTKTRAKSSDAIFAR